jgi:hypothetical protein
METCRHAGAHEVMVRRVIVYFVNALTDPIKRAQLRRVFVGHSSMFEGRFTPDQRTELFELGVAPIT